MLYHAVYNVRSTESTHTLQQTADIDLAQVVKHQNKLQNLANTHVSEQIQLVIDNIHSTFIRNKTEFTK